MSKIRIRFGEVEIEYEGEEKLNKKDLLDLISKVSEMHQVDPPVPSMGSTSKEPAQHIDKTKTVPQMTTKLVAQKMSAKSAAEVTLAAAVQLGYVQGKNRFSRKEILETMKSAHGFYKEPMCKNLTNSLKNLTTQDLLIEPETHTFSLTGSGEQKAKNALG